jgi:hypothetical protein
VHPSEMSVHIYQTTQCHTPEDNNPHGTLMFVAESENGYLLVVLCTLTKFTDEVTIIDYLS